MSSDTNKRLRRFAENSTCSPDRAVESETIVLICVVFCYSVTGKKLMAKCRMLIQENQELGRQLSQGRVAQLEAELALQKKYSDELKGSQDGKHNQELVIYFVLPFIIFLGDILTEAKIMNRTGQLFWKHVKLFGVICEISFRETGITPSPDNSFKLGL